MHFFLSTVSSCKNNLTLFISPFSKHILSHLKSLSPPKVPHKSVVFAPKVPHKSVVFTQKVPHKSVVITLKVPHKSVNYFVMY